MTSENRSRQSWVVMNECMKKRQSITWVWEKKRALFLFEAPKKSMSRRWSLGRRQRAAASPKSWTSTILTRQKKWEKTPTIFLLQVKGTHIKCKVMHFSACASETLVGSTRKSNSETVLESVTLALGFGPVWHVSTCCTQFFFFNRTWLSCKLREK